MHNRPSPKLWFHVRSVRWAALTLGFATLATVSIWPAPRFARTTLPTGWSAPGTIPMLNAWTIWWNADRLRHGLAGYWNAPIFYPETGTFAFSEPQPATWIVAPLVWLMGSPVPAYQVYLMATLTLNALLAVRLLRTLRVRWATAAAGGAAVLLLPLVHQDRETVQLMALWGVLWTLDAVIWLRRRPSWSRGAVLGLALTAVFATCVHHGVFLMLLLGLSAWLTVPWRQWRKWLIAVFIAVFVATPLLAPLLLPMRHILAEHHFARRSPEVDGLSATASDWLQTMPGAAIRFPAVMRRAARPLSPGWIRTSLALVGVWLAARHRRERCVVLFLAILGCWAVFWSFGTNLSIGLWRPWRILADWAPGFSRVRSAYRFAYFAQLVVVLLGTVGLDRLLRSRAWRAWAERKRWLSRGLAGLACALVAFEVPPAPLELTSVVEPAEKPAWADFVRSHTSAGRGILCLPFPAGYQIEDYEQSARWMLLGVWHGTPMANGYSGFFPNSWIHMVETLRHDPFSDSALALMTKSGIEHVVIDTRLMPGNQSPAALHGRDRLVRVFDDGSGVEVWRLR